MSTVKPIEVYYPSAEKPGELIHLSFEIPACRLMEISLRGEWVVKSIDALESGGGTSVEFQKCPVTDGLIINRVFSKSTTIVISVVQNHAGDELFLSAWICERCVHESEPDGSMLMAKRVPSSEHGSIRIPSENGSMLIAQQIPSSEFNERKSDDCLGSKILQLEGRLFDEARVALANVSGAIVDSGLELPDDERYYGDAVRRLHDQRDEMEIRNQALSRYCLDLYRRSEIERTRWSDAATMLKKEREDRQRLEAKLRNVTASIAASIRSSADLKNDPILRVLADAIEDSSR